jgi:hypothetical protein
LAKNNTLKNIVDEDLGVSEINDSGKNIPKGTQEGNGKTPNANAEEISRA